MKGTWYSSAHLSCSGGCQHHRQDSSIQSRQNFPFHKGLIEYHIAVCRNPLLHCSKGPYSLSFRYLPCRLFQSIYTNESFLPALSVLPVAINPTSSLNTVLCLPSVPCYCPLERDHELTGISAVGGYC